MSVWGKILGGVGGFAIGGPLGALIGTAAGALTAGTLAILKNTASRTSKEWMNAVAAIMHKPLSKDTAVAKVANTFLSMVNQEYIGDVNILPRSRFYNPFKILSRLSTDEVMKLVTAGERATWRRMEMIRVQTRISKTLDRLLREYEVEFLRNHHPALNRKRAA